MRRLRLLGVTAIVVALLLPGVTVDTSGHDPLRYAPVAPSEFTPWPTEPVPVRPVRVSPVAAVEVYDVPVQREASPPHRAPQPVAVRSVPRKATPKASTHKARPARVRTARASGPQVRGVATYYCWPGGHPPSPCMAAHPNGGMYAAAGPALRAAMCGSSTSECWRGKTVSVTGPKGTQTVTLSDWCACSGGHLIDLYHDVLVIVTDSPWGATVTVRW